MGSLQTGTGRDDYLQGTNAADHLNGKGGNDLLSGNGGNDVYTGGAGFDMFLNAHGDGIDTVTDYQMGETLILQHGSISAPDHYLANGESFSTSTGEVFHAYEDANGAAHLEVTDPTGQVSGIVLQHTNVASLYTGWFCWNQGQPDAPGYTFFGGLSAY